MDGSRRQCILEQYSSSMMNVCIAAITPRIKVKPLQRPSEYRQLDCFLYEDVRDLKKMCNGFCKLSPVIFCLERCKVVGNILERNHFFRKLIVRHTGQGCITHILPNAGSERQRAAGKGQK